MSSNITLQKNKDVNYLMTTLFSTTLWLLSLILVKFGHVYLCPFKVSGLCRPLSGNFFFLQSNVCCGQHLHGKCSLLSLFIRLRRKH